MRAAGAVARSGPAPLGTRCPPSQGPALNGFQRPLEGVSRQDDGRWEGATHLDPIEGNRGRRRASRDTRRRPSLEVVTRSLIGVNAFVSTYLAVFFGFFSIFTSSTITCGCIDWACRGPEVGDGDGLLWGTYTKGGFEKGNLFRNVIFLEDAIVLRGVFPQKGQAAFSDCFLGFPQDGSLSYGYSSSKAVPFVSGPQKGQTVFKGATFF